MGLYRRGTDWGGGALADRSWVDGFTHTIRFDFSASPVQPNGYSLNLFTSEGDAYVSVITKFLVAHSSPLAVNVWRTGLRSEGGRMPDQARDGDFLQAEMITPAQFPQNGFVGPKLQEELREAVYVFKPSKIVTLLFYPLVPPHFNPANNPVGTVYIQGGRLQ